MADSDSTLVEKTADRRAYHKAWREANRQKLKEQAAAYYLANKEKIRAKQAEIYRSNPEKTLARNKIWQENNKLKLGEYSKKWRDKNKEKVAQKTARYREKNPEKLTRYRRENAKAIGVETKAWRLANLETARATEREWKAKKRETDPLFVIKERVRARLRDLFRKQTKSKNTLAILGCDWDFFMSHIERQFAPGMTWENRDQWHIDHILPIATAESAEDILALNHFTNMRPLWAHENMSKGDRVTHLI